MTSSPTSRVLPDSIEIVLPPEWADLPIDLADHDRFIAELVGASAIAESRPRVAQRRQLELLLARVAGVARDNRVVVAAAYVAPAEDEGGDILAACLVATTVARTDLGTDVPLLAEILVSGLARVERDDPHITHDEIEPPATTKIAGTEAVKVLRLVRFTDDRRRELKQFEQTYLVPVADGDGVVVLSFSTINFKYAKQFSELFEKIAHTLRILYPEDQTFEDEPKPMTSDQSGVTPA